MNVYFATFLQWFQRKVAVIGISVKRESEIRLWNVGSTCLIFCTAIPDHSNAEVDGSS